MAEIGAWKQDLWDDLDTMDPKKQFAVTGEWITWITQVLLPELGQRRREQVLVLIDDQGESPAYVASTLNVRRSTLTRLIDEGRASRRALRMTEEQALDDSPPLPVG